MNRLFFVGLLLLVSLFSACKSAAPTTENLPPLRVTFLHMNDVYEIGSLENGQAGGLARVAGLRKKLLQEDPNLHTVLAGDFLNPSLIATLKLEGERIKGRHMVDVLNTMGLDIACFGNHEFDLKAEELQARLDESTFDWISGNVRFVGEDGPQAFLKKGEEIPVYQILPIPNSSKKIGLFTVCLDANQVDYVQYEEVFSATERMLKELEPQVDYLIGLTHLAIGDDLELAKRFPQVHLIMGGHDHHNMMHKVGKTLVAKADANAKTVYVHRIQIDQQKKTLEVASELVRIDPSIPEDGNTRAVVDRWTALANRSFGEMGFNAEEKVAFFDPAMDARESILRFRPAPFAQLIARAMSAACPESEATILNAGAIRVDDLLEGNFTQYDVLRSLPFGGGMSEVRMEGSLLSRMLEAAWTNHGNGGFLQWDRIERAKEGFLLQGKPIEANRIYRVVVPDFLLTGLESRLSFFTPENPAIKEVLGKDYQQTNPLRADIRKALIDYLKKGGK